MNFLVSLFASRFVKMIAQEIVKAIVVVAARVTFLALNDHRYNQKKIENKYRIKDVTTRSKLRKFLTLKAKLLLLHLS